MTKQDHVVTQNHFFHIPQQATRRTRAGNSPIAFIKHLLFTAKKLSFLFHENRKNFDFT